MEMDETCWRGELRENRKELHVYVRSCEVMWMGFGMRRGGKLR